MRPCYPGQREHLVGDQEEINFNTLSGVLTARRNGPSIVLDFPARSVEPAESNQALNQALGAIPTFTSKYTTQKGTTYLLEFETEAIVRGLRPDFKSLEKAGARMAIATSRSATGEQDFVSRCFA